MAITIGQVIGNIDSGPLERQGWYATLHSWDPNEGIFPGAHYWDGARWQPETTAALQYWPTVFETEEEACAYAYEHDPDL